MKKLLKCIIIIRVLWKYKLVVMLIGFGYMVSKKSLGNIFFYRIFFMFF